MGPMRLETGPATTLIFLLLAVAPGEACPQGHAILPMRARRADLPVDLAQRMIATGLDEATALAVAPDGRVFLCEQGSRCAC